MWPEIVSKAQTMRKEAGFEVTDRIAVGYEADVELARVIAQYAAQISAAVLADSLHPVHDSEGWHEKEWNINGLRAVLTIKKGEEF